MEYLDFLNRSEVVAEHGRARTELNQLKIKKESSDDIEKQRVVELKTELELIVKTCEERLKAQNEDRKLLEADQRNADKELVALRNEQAMVKSMKETALKQNLSDVVRTIPRLKTGDSIEHFVSSLEQIYSIEVKPQLAALPILEGEFIKEAKRLLTYPMFTQLEKSGRDTKTWVNLQKYLTETHGTRISNYQHLNRLWNCEVQESEKLSEFASRLEEKCYSASTHIQSNFKQSHSNADMTADDVFKLIGAMLASIQVRSKHEDAYKSLIKNCDKHWSASSILSDAADYVDKMSSPDETDDPSQKVFLAKTSKPKKHNQLQKPYEKKPKKQSRSTSLEDYKKRCSKEICEAFLQNKCRYGTKCFRIHPDKSVHYTTTEQEDCELGSLFHQGPEQTN